MRKSQISVEFAMIFTVAIFLVIFILSFVPGWLSSANNPASEARNWARMVKEKTIAASLSSTDFETVITIPGLMGYASVNATIVVDESLLMIKDSRTGRTLARAFLPELNGTGTLVANTLVITKAGNELSITRWEG